MTGPAIDPSERRLAEAGVLLVVVAWAANFVVVKAVVGDIPPLVFTGLRYLAAAATVMALLRWREGSIGLPRTDLVRVGGLGVMGFTVYQILWTVGLTQITAGDSALLIAATPVMVALIASAMGTDMLSSAKLIGALVSFAGVALVIGAGPGGGVSLGTSIVGDVITLGGALAWALYTSVAARLMRRISPLRMTAWAITGGMIVLVPIGAWQAATSPPFAIEPPHVAGILYSGVVAAGIANVLVSRGVKVLGPTRVTVLQYGVPALAVVFGAIFLDEAVRAAQIIGGIVIILGVVITRSRRGGGPIRFRRRAQAV